MATTSRFGYVESKAGDRVAVVKANAEQEEKIFDELVKKRLSKEKKQHEERVRLMEATRKAIVDAEAAGNAEEAALLRRKLGGFKAAETQYERKQQELREDAVKRAIAFEVQQYQKLSARKRMEVNKAAVDELSARKEAIEAQYSAELAEFEDLQSRKESLTDEERKRFDTLTTDLQDVQLELKDIDANLPVAQAAFDSLFNKIGTATDKANAALEKYNKAKERAEVAEVELREWEEQHLKELDAAQKRGDMAEMTRLQDEWQAQLKIYETAQQTAKQEEASYKAADKAAKKEEEAAERRLKAEKNREELLNRFTDMNKVSENIEKNLNDIFGNRAKMMARLQGSTEDWGKAIDNVSDSIGFSGILKKRTVFEQMSKLVDAGIAYNIELRAFLAATSENIASTFDAFDGTLLRMIRLQQADTTAARLGMEATLTQLFNKLFNDTTYLKDASDQVTQAILDASAGMSRDDSLEFEYTLQKWLGSLYSLGLSGDTVTKIASGINYLGTGNYSALGNDTALQTLITMAAARSGGKTYDQLLLGGVSAEDTNTLLRSIVEMLTEIATNQENNVTTSAYAQLFNMSVTDLRAFSSLTTKEINQLYNSSVDYNSLINETQSQLSKISSRMSLTDLVNNAIDNAEMGIATTIGGNAFTYGTWKALGLLTDYVGEIRIPGVTAFGTGVASGIDILNTAKTLMAGMGLVGSLLGGLGGLGSMVSGGPQNLNAWDWDEYTNRGSSLTLLSSGVAESTSASAVIGTGSSSGDDMTASSLESSKDSGMEASGTSSEEMEESKEIPKKIWEAIDGDRDITVIKLLQSIDAYSKDIEQNTDPIKDIPQYLDYKRVFYTAIAGVMSSDAASQLTNLSAQLEGYKAAAAFDEQTEVIPGVTSALETPSTNILSNSALPGLTPSNLLGGTSAPGDTAPVEATLQDMISAAVVAALNQFAFQGAAELPVKVNPFTSILI